MPITASILSNVLSRWQPRWVFLVGVAGGFPDLGVHRGDVILAKFVYYMEFGKLLRGRFVRRPDYDYRPDHALFQHAMTIAEANDRSWLDHVRVPRPDGHPPSASAIKDGYVGSGDKVIDDPDHSFYRAVKATIPEIHAVEMEGSGACAAIHLEQSRRAVGFLMVRGISDEPGDSGSAGSQQRSLWKAYAADVAATFVETVLSKLPTPSDLQPSNPRPTHRTEASVLSPATQADDLLIRVRDTATLARQALEPHAIPRIARAVVRDRLMPALQRGLEGTRPRIVPIVGPSGYGKTTILGELFDGMTALGSGWIAIARCSDLILDTHASTASFSAAVGEVTVGFPVPFPTLAASLTDISGRGVLLVDTIDLILTEHLARILHQFLRQVADTGTTIAITCRDHEYGAFLEPPHHKLTTIAPLIDRHNVSAFTTDEVELAATRFIDSTQLPVNALAFARSLLALSADSRSLRDIVHNPLLLSMLCELFAKDGVVPGDLTVSRLYEQYWAARVEGSRKHGRTSPEATEKVRICLHIAKKLLDTSNGQLRDTLDELDASLDSTQITSSAYDELRSDGVLLRLAASRISFFHQTFLEYNIARLLATQTGELDREAILHRLNTPALRATTMHWWSILRQLLAILQDTDFNQTVQRIDLTHLPAFRAVAFAAASRPNNNTMLTNLLPIALAQQGEFEHLLCEAVASVIPALTATACDIALTLLARGLPRTALLAADTLGGLFARNEQILTRRFGEATAAMHDRATSSRIPGDTSEHTALLIHLVRSLRDSRRKPLPPNVLLILREQYAVLGDAGKALVADLHDQVNVPVFDRIALLSVALDHPAPALSRQALTHLVLEAWPHLDQLRPKVNWSSWQQVLHDKRKEGWQEVLANAIGHRLAGDPDALRHVLRELVAGPGPRVQANLLALTTAVTHGVGEEVAAQLRRTDLHGLPVQRIRPLGVLLSEMAPLLRKEDHRTLVHHLNEVLRQHSDILLPLVITLFDETTWNSDLVPSALRAAPVSRRSETVRQILKRANVDLRPLLLRQLDDFFAQHRSDGSWEAARIEFYGVAATDSAAAIAGLLEAAAGNAQTTATAAARHLVSLVGTAPNIGPSQLIELAHSRFGAVRVSAVEALFRMLDSQRLLDPTEMDRLAAILKSEDTPSVWHALLKLIDAYAHRAGSLPLTTLALIEDAVVHVLSQTSQGQAIARPLLGLLKVLAQREDLGLEIRLQDWAKRLLTSIDIRRIRDGESLAVDLAAALARHDREFLTQLVGELAALSPQNARAVAMAIRRVEGPGSQLIEQLLSDPACPDFVVRLILEWRAP